MVDRSSYPCKISGHRQNDHGKHFGLCYLCIDHNKSGQHCFERIGNLEFLEWLDKTKEK